MTDHQLFAALGTGLLVLVHLAVIARVILRPHREPASRVAWIVVIVAIPAVGLIAYLMLGETSVGRRRIARVREVLADMPEVAKILVIDNRITYCGSQNCADPEFLVKAKFAPWVDAMMRFTGPIVRQNQHLFASDWMSQVDEKLDDILTEAMPLGEAGFTAQVIGTGPTVRNSAMPEIFENLFYTARREIFITTPYYVPDEPLQTALCSCAQRGVKTTLVLPARNDSWIVGAASRSYYADLLAAGVQIHEYEGGLLHTKSLTLDDEITLIGSANMDRRSFELNYENNILLCDRDVTAEMRRRQDEYLAHSHPVTAEMVAAWPLRHQFWNNSIAMLGPVL